MMIMNIVSIFKRLPILALMALPTFAFADASDSERTVTDAMLHILTQLEPVPMFILVMAVPAGLFFLFWSVFQMISKHKNQQITWKGIMARLLAAGLLLSSLTFVFDLGNTIYGTGGTTQQFLNEEAQKGDIATSGHASISKCVKNTTQSNCARY